METTRNEKEMSRLNKIIQKRERNSINVLIKNDGSSTEPGTDTLNLLISTHFPAATTTTPPRYTPEPKHHLSVISGQYDEWINPDLVREALGGFEDKKSPGPDGLKPIVFKYFNFTILEYISLIYRVSIYLNYTPRLWKETDVIFIPKPGKDEYNKAKSFRPISLSNYLLKGLERLTGWRMDKALLSNPLHPKQHGFMKNKSTESALSNTCNYIERFLFRNEYALGIFLDISSAFDSISPEHIRDCLLKHGGDPDMVSWYYNYLIFRNLNFRLHGERTRRTTGMGFPQGGSRVCKILANSL